MVGTGSGVPNIRRKNVENFDQFLKEINQFKTVVPSAFLVCRDAVTAAYGVSSKERSFSQLKLVKTSLRTVMADNRLNSLMLLKCEQELASRLHLQTFVEQWSTPYSEEKAEQDNVR